MGVRCVGIIAAGVLVLSVVAQGSSGQEGRPEGRTTLSIAQREDLSREALTILNAKCTVCHTSERFEAHHFTPEQWARVIESMVARGASLSVEERDTLLRWKESE